MTDMSFVLSIIILTLIFLVRMKIVEMINNNFNLKTKVESEWVVYFITFAFIIVIIAGMLLDGTKKKYSSVSDGFEKIQSRPNDRPNPMFDINTYW